jgi:hypothetical protein
MSPPQRASAPGRRAASVADLGQPSVCPGGAGQPAPLRPMAACQHDGMGGPARVSPTARAVRRMGADGCEWETPVGGSPGRAGDLVLDNASTRADPQVIGAIAGCVPYSDADSPSASEPHQAGRRCLPGAGVPDGIPTIRDGETVG